MCIFILVETSAYVASKTTKAGVKLALNAQHQENFPTAAEAFCAIASSSLTGGIMVI